PPVLKQVQRRFLIIYPRAHLKTIPVSLYVSSSLNFLSILYSLYVVRSKEPYIVYHLPCLISMSFTYAHKPKDFTSLKNAPCIRVDNLMQETYADRPFYLQN